MSEMSENYPRKITWVGLDVVGIIAVTIVLLVLGFAVLFLVSGIEISEEVNFEPTLGFNLGAAAIQTGAMIAAVAGIGFFRSVDWKEVGLRGMSSKWLIISIALGILCIPLTGWIAYVVQLLLGEDLTNPQLDFIIPEGFSWSALIGMTILVGIVTPFAEELFFRGVVHKWLRNHFSFWIAGSISSLIFGLVHVLPSLIAGTAVLGLCAAWVYEKSGSIWSAILIHAINNAVKVVALYLLLLYPTLLG